MEERGTGIAVKSLRKITKNMLIFCLGSGNRKREFTNKNQSTSHSPLLSLCFTFKFVSYNAWLSAVDSQLGLRVWTCQSCTFVFLIAHEKERGGPPPSYHVVVYDFTEVVIV